MNFNTIFYLIENYKTAYQILSSKNPDKIEEIKKLLDKHQKLRNLRRLHTSDVNIDILVKNGFEKFKEIVNSYSDDLLKTKKDIINNLEIFDHNNEYTIIKIHNQLECNVLSHGRACWCISSNDEDAKHWFDHYFKDAQLYIALRRKPKDDNLDILAIIKSNNGIEVKNRYDEAVDFYSINIPHLKIEQDTIEKQK